MKLAKFTYRDAKGKVTDREVLVTGMPSDKLMGIDTKDMTDEDIGIFIANYEDLYNDFLMQVDALKRDCDCTNNYRTFFPESMSNLVIQNV